MKIKLLKDAETHEKKWKKGDEVDMQDAIATVWIEKKIAEKVVAKKK